MFPSCWASRGAAFAKILSKNVAAADQRPSASNRWKGKKKNSHRSFNPEFLSGISVTGGEKKELDN